MMMRLWQNVSPMGKRVRTIIIVFILSVVITALATLTPIGTQEAIDANNKLSQTVNVLKDNNLLLQYIFGNNFMITLIMFIPFVGPIFGAYAFYNTGVVIGAIAKAQGFPPLLDFLALFLTPVAWLEFVAYATAIAASFWLSLRIVQHGARHELVNTVKFISVCAALLLIGAIVETALIYAL